MSSLRQHPHSEPRPRTSQRKLARPERRPSPGERAEWDRRYREGSHKWRRPDSFLAEAYRQHVAPAFRRPGRALDLAGGAGRHALWLARRGWRVTLADISAVGLAKAGEKAAARGLKLKLRRQDLRPARLPRGRYDLIVVFFFLERKLFPALARALKPGGILIYKTYTLQQRKLKSGGPSNPHYLLKRNELRRAFPGLRVLSYREVVGEKAVAELVARKIDD